jgi:hypothetical protein
MPEISPSKYLVTAGWDDVPHLDEKTKAELLAATPPYLRDARSKGTPSLGPGAIYPVPENEIVVDPFAIPDHWPRSFGLDVGWNRTAAVWGAIDRETNVSYLFAEYYRGQAEPSVHVAGIKGRGEWIPGVIDPASRGRTQRDGEQLLHDFISLGLPATLANNAREAGIYAVWELLSTGRLKVFKTLQNWLSEYRVYRRDDKGAVVKEYDHLMDATRYWTVSGRDVAIIKPVAGSAWSRGNMNSGSWMSA